MKQNTLQAVLRKLSDAAPAADDGELLRRFAAGDGDAFAELVRRHGRLVWSVCRHLTRSDAEADDAFQATFLVLLRSASKVRDAARLSAWLHGVAYRVCAKARQSAARRAARERVAAVGERNGHAVADSAWDRALAAVHEEAGRLPDSLRVPFVLCCLEGKGVTEAAEQLGWKLGTLSGRLTRAKDAVLARLEARGLTLLAVAGVGLTAPPASAVANALALARAGSAIPNSILQLTQGVIGMSATSFKLLAAAVMLAGGLGLTAGSGWLATAGAQSPLTAAGAQSPPVTLPAKKADPADEVQRLQEQLEKARQAARDQEQLALDAEKAARAQQEMLYLRAVEAAQAGLKGGKEEASAKTKKWDYDFVLVSDMTQNKFVEFLQDRENRGWDYAGTTKLLHQGKPADIWVFRRPARGTASQPSQAALEYFRRAVELQGDPIAPRRAEVTAAKSEEVKALESQIEQLQMRLKMLTAKADTPRLLIEKKDLPLDPAEMAEVLRKLAAKKFPGGQYTFTPTATGLSIGGGKDVVEWAEGVIKKLKDQ